MPLLVVNAILVISLAILNESTLSFLGWAIRLRIHGGRCSTLPSARGNERRSLVGIVRAGLRIVWVVLGLTLLGHGLEQVLNPRLEAHHLMPGRPRSRVKRGVAHPPAAQKKDAPGPAGCPESFRQLCNEGNRPAVWITSAFKLHEGELLGLVGESGCGKTTLMMALMRLLPAAGGIVGGHICISRAKDLAT
jgi:ABC-type multidrug transport system fused ATPase/permease subunit